MGIEIGPPQAGNFEDLGGCFMQKMHQNCTQERVFLYKISLNIKKKSACGGHICCRNPFSNASKVIFFFAPAAGHRNAFVFYLCLQGASTQA